MSSYGKKLSEQNNNAQYFHNTLTEFERANQILSSLDDVKKDIEKADADVKKEYEKLKGDVEKKNNKESK